MPCPYLKEVVMAFCRAYPVKKLVPAENLQASRCDGRFEECPLFAELVARALTDAEGESDMLPCHALERPAGKKGHG